MLVVAMGKLEDLIISTLENSNEGLTLAEIAEKVGQPEKKIFKTLRKLFTKDIIDSQNRHYRLSNR
jgi:predicted transcriptional regulator